MDEDKVNRLERDANDARYEYLEKRIADTHIFTQWTLGAITLIFLIVGVITTTLSISSRRDVSEAVRDMEQRFEVLSERSTLAPTLVLESGERQIVDRLIEAQLFPYYEVTDAFRKRLARARVDTTSISGVPGSWNKEVFYRNLKMYHGVDLDSLGITIPRAVWANVFSMPSVQLHNIGNGPTKHISVKVHFQHPVFIGDNSDQWQIHDSTESHFASVVSMAQDVVISPQETWTLIPFDVFPAEDPGNEMKCKITVFYGEAQPVSANFVFKLIIRNDK